MMHTQHQKDWMSCPGDSILTFLKNKNIRPSELYPKLGLDRSSFSALTEGRMEINESLAEKLAFSIGSTKSFWLKREENYRSQVEELEKRRAEDEEWLNLIPVQYLNQNNFIASSRKTSDKIKGCLSFFSVRSSSEWYSKYSDKVFQAAYRTSNTFDSTPESIVTWLTVGEKLSKPNPKQWNKEKLIQKISELRKLTTVKDPKIFLPTLKETFASCGVSLVIARTPEKCRASGATFFSDSRNPIIVLSFRYLSDDQLWFTIFHEIGHLILHDSSLIFLEGLGISNEIENEANAFSEKTLIPEALQAEFKKLSLKNWRQIPRFARKAGISPGIVVGQLQNKKLIAHNQMNKFKVRYKLEDINH